jgi:hypothetical protein
MGTQKGGYFVQDGTKVPSVTTIISRFKESGGLIHWAWKLGTEGKDYRKERDDAANAGTLAHAMVEEWFKGESPERVLDGVEDGTANKARLAYLSFKEWAGQTQLKITHSELPLVSEKYRFGGTLDCMLVNSKRSLGDIKTSSSIYHDYLMQLAAYGILWDENYPDEPIEGGYHIMRFSKDDGDFEHRWFGELSDAREMFIHLRAAYEYDAKLKKRIR